MYSQSITRSNRALFVIAIDQSCSMAGAVHSSSGEATTKAELVARVANDLIAELIERSRRSEGLRDYYDIAVVGYSGEGVHSLLSSESRYVSVLQLDKLPTKQHSFNQEICLPNGELRFTRINQRRWIEPQSVGLTPMFEGLFTVYNIAKKWCAEPKNLDSFPPLIFNITDGESTDCDYQDIVDIASRIKTVATTDGNALLINIHIAPESSESSLLFPSQAEIDRLRNISRSALSLFKASSTLPPIFMDAVCEIKGTEYRDNYKAMSFNCSIAELVTIINIGSISVKCR